MKHLNVHARLNKVESGIADSTAADVGELLIEALDELEQNDPDLATIATPLANNVAMKIRDLAENFLGLVANDNAKDLKTLYSKLKNIN